MSKLTKQRDALVEVSDEQESYITVQNEEKRDLNATIDRLKGELDCAQRAEGIAAEAGERECKLLARESRRPVKLLHWQTRTPEEHPGCATRG